MRRHLGRWGLGIGCASALAILGSMATAQAAETCTLDKKFIEKAEQDAFPVFTEKNFDFQTNCAFHQWSWAMFLWLTEENKDGALRFEAMPTAREIMFPAQESDSSTMAPRLAKSDDIDVIGPTRKGDGEDFHLVEQAGSHGLLVDQQGRAVYYTEHANSIFANFVKKNGLSNPAKLRDFDAETDFPNGALELKASWKIVGPNMDTDGFYTRKAKIALLEAGNADGSDVRPGTKTQTETVALVGLHVVGTVPNHPEMIWATFEHNGNAPDFKKNQGVDKSVSDKDYTFYKGGTTARDCNQNNAHNLKLVDADKQTLEPVTQACRQFPRGGGKQSNQDNIAALNKSSHKVIKSSDSFDDLWTNYREIGAIWFKKENALKPNDPLNTNALITGSTRLNNATIETLTQQQQSRNNCFKCHNTMTRYSSHPEVEPLPGKNVNISHILVNAYMKKDAAAQSGE